MGSLPPCPGTGRAPKIYVILYKTSAPGTCDFSSSGSLLRGFPTKYFIKKCLEGLPMILSTDNKQKIDSIYGKLSRGEWFDAAFTAGVVIDFIVGEMLKEIIAALPPAELDPSQPAGKDNRKKRYKSWTTLGARVNLFKEENLFEQYESILGKSLPTLKQVNWDRIVEIRNNSAHPGNGLITPADAHEITSYLYLLLIELTDWHPQRSVSPMQKLASSKGFRWFMSIAALALVAFVIFTIFNLVVPVNQTIDKYGKEISAILEQGEDYKLAIWFMERDESASYRDTALFRLNFSRAQQLEQDNAYLAYQSYQKALKLCRNSNESIYCDENYIKKHQADLLLKMTPVNRFWARYKIAVIVVAAIVILISTRIIFGRKKPKKSK